MGEPPKDDDDDIDSLLDDDLLDDGGFTDAMPDLPEKPTARPVSQLLPHGDQVAIVTLDGFFASLSLADGSERWRYDQNPKNRHPYHIFGGLARDDGLYFSGAGSLKRLSWEDGTFRRLGVRNVNQACARTTATPNWVTFGWQTWVDRDWNWWLHASRRSGCAHGTVHANGMAYQTPTTCGCLSPLTGYAVYSKTPSLLAETPPLAVTTTQAALPGDAITAVQDQPRGPIDSEWRIEPWHRDDLTDEIEAVPAGDLQLVSRRFALRLEARRSDGSVAWAVALGANPGGPPLVHDGLVFQATEDEFVSAYDLAYDLADGTRRWTLRVAPGAEQIIDGCQLASPWPIRPVVLHRGKVCVAAGRHPEVDGGIMTVGIDPVTGAVAWRHPITKPIAHGFDTTGLRHTAILPTAPRHIRLVVTEEDLLALEGFAFDPDWSAEKVQEVLTKYGHRSRYSQLERP